MRERIKICEKVRKDLKELEKLKSAKLMDGGEKLPFKIQFIDNVTSWNCFFTHFFTIIA